MKIDSMTQRDAFWNQIYKRAKEDSNIIVISADMGAPALDQFRQNLPQQFINVGIAEQNGILIATGLALSGKKVFFYGIAPFVTLRCLEQIRVSCAIMKVPITIVGVGAGFGYEDSGPTHHIIEDIAIMRSMPNIIIHSISDNRMASAIADISCSLPIANYVRLDRQKLPIIYDKNTDFSGGFHVTGKGDVYVISTGSIIHLVREFAEGMKKSGVNVGVIDVYEFPIQSCEFIHTIKDAKCLMTIEEHFLPGGLGSAVCEVLNDSGILIPVQRVGLNPKRGYYFKYGGRDIIRSDYGLDINMFRWHMWGLLRKLNLTSYSYP